MRHDTFCDTGGLSSTKISLWHPVYDKLSFLVTTYDSSVTDAQHYNTKSMRKKKNRNINPNSIFTNTVVTTTVGFSDLNFK